MLPKQNIQIGNNNMIFQFKEQFQRLNQKQDKFSNYQVRQNRQKKIIKQTIRKKCQYNEYQKKYQRINHHLDNSTKLLISNKKNNEKEKELKTYKNKLRTSHINATIDDKILSSSKISRLFMSGSKDSSKQTWQVVNPVKKKIILKKSRTEQQEQNEWFMATNSKRNYWLNKTMNNTKLPTRKTIHLHCKKKLTCTLFEASIKKKIKQQANNYQFDKEHLLLQNSISRLSETKKYKNNIKKITRNSPRKNKCESAKKLKQTWKNSCPSSPYNQIIKNSTSTLIPWQSKIISIGADMNRQNKYQMDPKFHDTYSKLKGYEFIKYYTNELELEGWFYQYELKGQPQSKWPILIIDQIFHRIKTEKSHQNCSRINKLKNDQYFF